MDPVHLGDSTMFIHWNENVKAAVIIQTSRAYLSLTMLLLSNLYFQDIIPRV